MENNANTKQLNKKSVKIIAIIVISLGFIIITVGILRNTGNTRNTVSDQVITDVIQEMYYEGNTYSDVTSSDTLIYRPIGGKVKTGLYSGIAKLTVKDNNIVEISTDTENDTQHIRNIFGYPRMNTRDMCDIYLRKVKEYKKTINNKGFIVEKYFVKWNIREGITERIVDQCEEYITFYIESDTDELVLVTLNDYILVRYELQGIETEYSNEE